MNDLSSTLLVDVVSNQIISTQVLSIQALSNPLLANDDSSNTDLSSERWFQLCQLATIEHDSEKILALAAEINRLLQEKEDAFDANLVGASLGSISQRYARTDEISC